VSHVVQREARKRRNYNLGKYGTTAGWVSPHRRKNIKERRVVNSNERYARFNKVKEIYAESRDVETDVQLNSDDTITYIRLI